MSADVSIEYTVKVSYMEIYMEKIKDLLQRELAFAAVSESSLLTRCSSERQLVYSRGQDAWGVRQGADRRVCRQRGGRLQGHAGGREQPGGVIYQ